MNKKLFLPLLIMFLIWGCTHRNINEPDMATLLAYCEEIADNFNQQNQSYYVRIYKTPQENGECWGKISSCPDVYILISIHEGDLYTKPGLHKLPVEKGWKFVRWESARPSTEMGVGFVLQTTLPEANIDLTERENWVPAEYNIWVTTESLKYEKVSKK